MYVSFTYRARAECHKSRVPQRLTSRLLALFAHMCSRCRARPAVYSLAFPGPPSGVLTSSPAGRNVPSGGGKPILSPHVEASDDGASRSAANPRHPPLVLPSMSPAEVSRRPRRDMRPPRGVRCRTLRALCRMRAASGGRNVVCTSLIFSASLLRTTEITVHLIPLAAPPPSAPALPKSTPLR